MPFDFETVDAELDTALKASLPNDWKVYDVANGATANPLSLTLSYLQTDVSIEWPGTGRMQDGYYAVSFQLQLSAPEKDLAKGSKRLMRSLPLLFNALDGLEDLEWSDATKGADERGVFYTIPVNILTHYNPTPKEE